MTPDGPVHDSPTSWVAAADEAGERIDVIVARRLGESRSAAQRRVDAGQVSVGGVTATKSRRIAVDDRIDVRPAAPPESPAAPPPVPVRYRDEHLLVVAKPAGLVVHPGAGVSAGTLVDALHAMDVPLADVGDPERPGIVHRLDRGTSGLMIVASTLEAHEALVDLLRRREVTRGYHALVDGVPVPPSATIDAPLGRDPRRRSRFAVDHAGRPAITHYDVVEDLGGAAFLEVRLETGRTHQVRVHLAAVGHPICGDETYGASARRAGALGLRRPALHAFHLAFDHPVTGTPIELREPLPEDLVAALDTLRTPLG